MVLLAPTPTQSWLFAICEPANGIVQIQLDLAWAYASDRRADNPAPYKIGNLREPRSIETNRLPG